MHSYSWLGAFFSHTSYRAIPVLGHSTNRTPPTSNDMCWFQLFLYVFAHAHRLQKTESYSMSMDFWNRHTVVMPDRYQALSARKLIMILVLAEVPPLAGRYK